MKPRLFAALLAAALAGGCNSNSLNKITPPLPTDCADLQPGATLRYDYTGYDMHEHALLDGVLTLVFAAPEDDPDRLADITGVWEIEALVDGLNVGPQIGHGALTGFLSRSGTVQLDLNPDMVDNNVLLWGQAHPCAALAFEGDWAYSTIVGPRVRGLFRAERKP